MRRRKVNERENELATLFFFFFFGKEGLQGRSKSKYILRISFFPLLPASLIRNISSTMEI